MKNTTSQSRFHEAAVEETVRYRAVEPLALLCAALALPAILVIFDMVYSFFPILSILFGLLSLVRMKSRPGIFLGRKAVLFGVGLSLLCLSAGTARDATSRHLLCRQTTAIGQEFLDLIAADHPELAYQWTLHPSERSRSSSDAWGYYKSNPEFVEKFREFVDNEGIRALLAIGKNAKIYPVGRPGFVNDKVIKQFYAVDFERGGKKKTFFFSLFLQPFQSHKGTQEWKVRFYKGGIDPWKKKEEEA